MGMSLAPQGALFKTSPNELGPLETGKVSLFPVATHSLCVSASVGHLSPTNLTSWGSSWLALSQLWDGERGFRHLLQDQWVRSFKILSVQARCLCKMCHLKARLLPFPWALTPTYSQSCPNLQVATSNLILLDNDHCARLHNERQFSASSCAPAFCIDLSILPTKGAECISHLLTLGSAMWLALGNRMKWKRQGTITSLGLERPWRVLSTDMWVLFLVLSHWILGRGL